MTREIRKHLVQSLAVVKIIIKLHYLLQKCFISLSLLCSCRLYLRMIWNVNVDRHKVAISDVHGEYLYEDLYLRSWDLAQGIRDLLGKLSQQHTSCH